MIFHLKWEHSLFLLLDKFKLGLFVDFGVTGSPSGPLGLVCNDGEDTPQESFGGDGLLSESSFSSSDFLLEGESNRLLTRLSSCSIDRENEGDKQVFIQEM